MQRYLWPTYEEAKSLRQFYEEFHAIMHCAIH